MSNVAFQIAVIVLLILLNGFFAMSETALVSSRKTRLRQRAEEGDRGARTALELADSPNRFLSTVQIGISLIGVLAPSVGRRSPSRWRACCAACPRWHHTPGP
jgi:putative hemolysin